MADVPVLRSIELPAEFAALAGYVPEWVGLDEGGRAARRANSSMDKLRELYEIAMPLMPSMLERLQRAPVTDTSETDLALLDLVLAVTEASFAVEIYGRARPDGVFDVERVKFATHDGIVRHGDKRHSM